MKRGRDLMGARRNRLICSGERGEDDDGMMKGKKKRWYERGG